VDPFDRLLSQMPAIAKAVNGFTSEQVQQQAFRALISAIGGEVSPGTGDTETETDTGAGTAPKRRSTTRRRARGKAAATASEGASAAGTAPRRRSTATGPSIDKNLNLRPAGVESLADFAASKNPTSDHERSLVAVYWLTRIAEVKATIDAVYTCYKDRKWVVPTNLRNALPLTASKKGWLITENLDDIKVSVPGENHVEHSLPAKTAKA
jgi:hypothetical protein